MFSQHWVNFLIFILKLKPSLQVCVVTNGCNLRLPHLHPQETEAGLPVQLRYKVSSRPALANKSLPQNKTTNRLRLGVGLISSPLKEETLHSSTPGFRGVRGCYSLGPMVDVGHCRSSVTLMVPSHLGICTVCFLLLSHTRALFSFDT